MWRWLVVLVACASSPPVTSLVTAPPTSPVIHEEPPPSDPIPDPPPPSPPTTPVTCQTACTCASAFPATVTFTNTAAFDVDGCAAFNKAIKKLTYGNIPPATALAFTLARATRRPHEIWGSLDCVMTLAATSSSIAASATVQYKTYDASAMLDLVEATMQDILVRGVASALQSAVPSTPPPTNMVNAFVATMNCRPHACTCPSTIFTKVAFTNNTGYQFDGCAVIKSASALLSRPRPNTSIAVAAIRADDQPAKFEVMFVLEVTSPGANSRTQFTVDATTPIPVRANEFLARLEISIGAELKQHGTRP